jgi:hypothetical protein
LIICLFASLKVPPPLTSNKRVVALGPKRSIEGADFALPSSKFRIRMIKYHSTFITLNEKMGHKKEVLSMEILVRVALFTCVVLLASDLQACKKSSRSAAKSNRGEAGATERVGAESLLDAYFATADVPSVEGAIESLPEEFRKYYALVYATQSIKKNVSGAVGPTNPRVILSRRDATSLIAFYGQPDRGVDEIESIDFDPRKNAYKAVKYKLDPSLSGTARVQKDDTGKTCQGCHSPRLHPVIDHYDIWPGWYGGSGLEDKDRVHMETAWFEQLKATAPAHPRFGKLLDLSSMTGPESHTRLLRLQAAMTQVNLRSIVQQLRTLVESQPQGERDTWMNALRAALVEGISYSIKTPVVPKDFYLTFVPEAKRESTRAAATAWEPKIQKASAEYATFRFDFIKNLGAYGKSVFNRNADLEHGDINKQPAFFAVAEALGATGLESWSLALATKPVYSFSDARGNISCALNYLEQWETLTEDSPYINCTTKQVNALIQTVGERLKLSTSPGGAKPSSGLQGEVLSLTGAPKDKMAAVEALLQSGKTVSVVRAANERCAAGSRIVKTQLIDGVGSIIYLEKGWCEATFLESIAVK